MIGRLDLATHPSVNELLRRDQLAGLAGCC